jgi:hypothetical protein
MLKDLGIGRSEISRVVRHGRGEGRPSTRGAGPFQGVDHDRLILATDMAALPLNARPGQPSLVRRPNNARNDPAKAYVHLVAEHR